MTGVLDQPIFKDDDAAREWLEAQLWPDGPICPHCGAVDRIHRLKGKSHRPGLHKCYHCHGHFTVTVNTLFERSKIPLYKWLLATYFLCSSKKGISTHQLHRMLGISYKSTWFMTHRIREAMREGTFPGPMGGDGGTVEADETFIGGKANKPKGHRGYQHKEKVLALVERGGSLRTFHVPAVNAETLKPILKAQIAKHAHLRTDEAGYYKWATGEFASHEWVSHGASEYVRGDAHTNTLEGYFSIFKRGMKGTYQHCGAQHLKRYLCEFDFRYNNRELTDLERANTALKGATGKRLTYRRAGERPLLITQ